jgi:hypothetical protein
MFQWKEKEGLEGKEVEEQRQKKVRGRRRNQRRV